MWLAVPSIGLCPAERRYSGSRRVGASVDGDTPVSVTSVQLERDGSSQKSAPVFMDGSDDASTRQVDDDDFRDGSSCKYVPYTT